MNELPEADWRIFRELRQGLAKMFDDPRRSRMIIQLAEICVHHLLQPDELGRFSVKTRATIEALLERDAI